MKRTCEKQPLSARSPSQTHKGGAHGCGRLPAPTLWWSASSGAGPGRSGTHGPWREVLGGQGRSGTSMMSTSGSPWSRPVIESARGKSIVARRAATCRDVGTV